MIIDKAFPSRWLRAVDILEPVLVTIRDVTMEKFDDSTEKAICWFQETEQGLVLNKTNAKTLEKLFNSPDTDTWKGKQVGLRQEMVQFKAERVAALRFFDPRPPKIAGFTAKQPPVMATDTDNVPDSWEVPDPDPKDYPRGVIGRKVG